MMNGNETKCINGALRVGDLVISTPDDEYSCLVGRVVDVKLAGTPGHSEEADNATDNVHVNFAEFDYPKQRVSEIEGLLTRYCGEEKQITDCPLDDVIMAPGTLIRITGMDDIRLKHLLASGFNAAAYCYEVLYNLHKQPKPESAPDPSDIAIGILGAISSALALSGYKIVDGGNDFLIICHSKSGSNFEIKADYLPWQVAAVQKQGTGSAGH